MPEEAGRGARMPHRCCCAGPAPRPPVPCKALQGKAGEPPAHSAPRPHREPGCPGGLRPGSPGRAGAPGCAMAAEESQGLAQSLARLGDGSRSLRSAPLLLGQPSSAPESRRACVRAGRAAACGSPGAALSAEQAGSAVPGHGSSHTRPLPRVRVLCKAGSCTSPSTLPLNSEGVFTCET